MDLPQYLIIVLAAFGELVALYFSLATYHLVREDLIESMPVCNVHGKKQRIVDTFYGRVFYLPNSMYGILYYLLVSVYTLIWWQTKFPVIDTAAVVVSFGVFVFSVFLYWSLRNRLYTICKLCITTHVINTVIFLLFGWRYLQLY